MNARIAVRLSALILVVTGLARAQEQTISTEPPPLPPPIRIDAGKTGLPIVLQSLDLRSEIVGGMARTRAEMLFANPNDRVLEGELQFPLLAGQEIDGFALDIDGELREAVPIEKARGKQVFEEVIRRRVDPALLEKTTGENFRLRVYPLPPRGTRRVVVWYSERLDSRQGQYRYRQALAQAAAMAEFSLEVLVASPAAAPTGVVPGGTAITLEESGTWYRGEIRRKDFAARGWVEIAIPDGGTDSAGLAASVQSWRDGNYLQFDAPIRVQRSARTIPARVGIVWDSSMSGRSRDHEAELALLDAYFQALRNGVVSLVRLRDVAEPAQEFTIRNGDWSALRQALQETVYDGASDLEGWKLDAGIREVLLFSDGLGNYGRSARRPAHLSGRRLGLGESRLSAPARA